MGDSGVPAAGAAFAARPDHFEAAFRAMPDGVIIASYADRIILDVNPAFERLLGWRREEIVGQSTRVLHPDEGAWARIGERLREQVTRGELTYMEHELHHCDGTPIPFEITLNALRDAQGEPTGLVGILRDMRPRQEAEDALRRLALIAQSSVDAIISATLEGRVTSWSAGAEAIYGWSADEMVGKPITRIMTPAGAAAWQGITARIAAGERVDLPRVERIRKDGGRILVDLRLQPLVDERGGRIVGMFGIARDVTRIHEAEEALRASESSFRELVEQSPLSVQVFDRSGQTLQVNDAWRRLWGVGDEIATVYNILRDPLLDARGVLPLVKRAFAGEAVEIPPLLYDPAELGMPGRARWVSARMYPVRDESGDVAKVVIVHEDITARRAAEDGLRQSEARWRSLVENLPAHVLILDEDGRILFLNHAPPGRRVDDFVGQPQDLFLRGDDAQRVARMRREVLMTGRTVTGEARFEIAPGEWRVYEMRMAPIREASGAARIIVVSSDVTLRRDAERELVAARRQLAVSERLSALGSLVSGVAHEVRTPLTILQTNVFLLEREAERIAGEAKETERVRETAAEIVASVDRINRLVDSLRRFTQHGLSERETASLHEAVAEALDLVRATHRGSVSVCPDLVPTPPVRLNRAQIMQVVINLVQNAIDASSDSAEPVRVVTRVGPEGAELVVEDRGVGMDADAQARMFEPLYTTKPHGTGLGLSIARSILDAHGARIACRSAPGEGTTFTLTFPPAA